jgi:hypothetical protein
VSLHDELVAGTRTSCIVCAFLATLPVAEAQAWQHELVQPVRTISNLAVERALKRRGVSVTEASVRRHRRNHTA